MAMDYCKEIGANHLETSAKENINVDEIFVELSKLINFILIER